MNSRIMHLKVLSLHQLMEQYLHRISSRKVTNQHMKDTRKEDLEVEHVRF